jgi:hypothetical protein
VAVRNPAARTRSSLNYDQSLQNIQDSPKIVTLRAPGKAASDVQFEFAKPAHGTLGQPSVASTTSQAARSFTTSA